MAGTAAGQGSHNEVETLLAQRDLPELLDTGPWPQRRSRLVGLLADEVYGHTPPAPTLVRGEVVHREDRAWSGSADLLSVELSHDVPVGELTLPVQYVLPRSGRPVALVVYLSFAPYPAAEYLPVEEIVDHGWALAVIHYEAVSRDVDDGFSSGLARSFPRERWDGGKLGMWAYAASRVLDHAVTLAQVDPTRCVVAGHSRLGKAALWCAAQDERFAAAFANESGCGGAALSRGKSGERIADITSEFPHWFGPRYRTWAGRETEAPFDQHMLIAALAPRPVYLASAAEDAWADPLSEFLGASAASEAWAVSGRRGLVSRGEVPGPGEELHDGWVGYHLRTGTHYLSRRDWVPALAFLDRRLATGSR